MVSFSSSFATAASHLCCSRVRTHRSRAPPQRPRRETPHDTPDTPLTTHLLAGTNTAWFEPFVAPALARVAGPVAAGSWLGSGERRLRAYTRSFGFSSFGLDLLLFHYFGLLSPLSIATSFGYAGSFSLNVYLTISFHVLSDFLFYFLSNHFSLIISLIFSPTFSIFASVSPALLPATLAYSTVKSVG